MSYQTINVRTLCQSCGAGLDTPYVLLGAAASCPSCGEMTIPRVPPGAARPRTHYEITFADFWRLLSDPYCRPSVAPLLRGWFGHELESAGDAVRVRSRDGGEVDPVALHLEIQGDEDKQGALYRTAMTLWR
jgi:predicted RNA-binding Zn-ribbon protein involved in translation (DUF1610 family)